MRVVCIFGGASSGDRPEYVALATALGDYLSEFDDIRVGKSHTHTHTHTYTHTCSPAHVYYYLAVYGGGTTGMMGAVASAVVRRRGTKAVLGVIPKALSVYEQRDSPDLSLFGEMCVCEDMHTRKARFATEVASGDAGSGFIVLPGGFGTLEEAIEVATFNSLSILSCGIVLLDVLNYYEPLMAWVQRASDAGFIVGENRSILQIAKSPEEAISLLGKLYSTHDVLSLDYSHNPRILTNYGKENTMVGSENHGDLITMVS